VGLQQHFNTFPIFDGKQLRDEEDRFMNNFKRYIANHKLTSKVKNFDHDPGPPALNFY